MLNTQGLQALGQQSLPPAQRAIMNLYAQYARSDGRGAYPSVATLAARTGYSVRHVRRVVRDLEAAGLLVPDGYGPKGTRQYAVACPPPDTMSAESSSSKDSKESYIYYDSWRTRTRTWAAAPEQKPAPATLHETPTARALLAAGIAPGDALAFGWIPAGQAAEVIGLAEKKARRGELRASQSAYVVGALRRIEAGERARYAADVQAGAFTGTWAGYCELLAAVQRAPVAPERRAGLVQDDLYREVDAPGPDDEMDIDAVYGVQLTTDKLIAIDGGIDERQRYKAPA